MIFKIFDWDRYPIKRVGGVLTMPEITGIPDENVKTSFSFLFFFLGLMQ